MSQRSSLRPIVAADHPAIVACNDAEVPRVGHLDTDGLADLLRFVDVGLLVEVDGVLAGFVLALPPGTAYGSVNYRAFEERGTDHLYVDRLVTAPAFRRRGLATRLSDAVEDQARATGRAEVTCEVNVRPPNPASLAFHRARGFREVGRQDTTGGALTVALLAKPLT
jgi:predicted GNAT superfamily acetyltransferase